MWYVAQVVVAHNIEVDWDPSSSTEYMCDEGVTLQPDHALQSPEGNVASKGQYTVELTTPARIVSDYHDSKICPGDERRRRLSDEAARLHENVQRLIRAYKRLVETK
nr:hypothetical protein BaRGS_035294 [Batillaria attramentaria]